MRNERSAAVGRRWVAGIALALTTLGVTHPDAPGADAPAERPAIGRFLVATESIRGSIFHESVVFLVNYSESGALGLIVNRPSHLALHEVVQGAVEGSGTLYVGGPVEGSTVMMLLRSDEPLERASQVAGDIYLSADPDLLLAKTAELDSGRLRVYAGYAGWGAKQLDAEIARGQWLVVAAPSESIFEQKPEGLWKRLFREYHRLIAWAAPPPPRFRS